ncbi:hypothetical protein HY256_02145, partial [Candidatus Sumerlaeota bacterium]|nr:hypothetical protein [Candidatus Sumerlaeota bacterium]
MSLLNSILTSLFSLLVLPLRGLSPFWALAIISLVAGILMLWIFGKVSNQEAIKRIRTTIGGNLIGARLYRHDIGVVTRLQARVIRDTFIYMRYSLAPMLIMFIPMTVILTQLNLNFESRPLKKGEKTLLKAKVRGEESLSGKIEIEVPKGIIVETPPVRIP